MTNINRCWLLVDAKGEAIAVYTSEGKGRDAVEFFLKEKPGFTLKEIYIYS